MPRDINGNYSLPPGTLVNNGETVMPSQHNTPFNDVAATLTRSLDRDGYGGMRANLNMNGFQIQNVGTATGPDGVATVKMVTDYSPPVGVIYDWVGDTAPTNHMLCYGQAISRTIYSELFSVIGTKFGNGDGSTTFNLPDFRGRVSVGKDDMGGADAGRMTFWGAAAKAIGGVFGTASVVLTVGQLAKHSHSGLRTSGAVSRDGWGTSGGPFGSGPSGRLVVTSGATEVGENLESLRNAGSSSSITLTGSGNSNESGNNEAHSNTQPSIVMNKIIKVSNG